MLKSNEGLHTTRARLPWASVGFKRPMVGACQHEGLHTTRAHLPQTSVGFKRPMVGTCQHGEPMLVDQVRALIS